VGLIQCRGFSQSVSIFDLVFLNLGNSQDSYSLSGDYQTAIRRLPGETLETILTILIKRLETVWRTMLQLTAVDFGGRTWRTKNESTTPDISKKEYQQNDPQ